MIKFSVIIPVYNSEKYLKKCLDSLLNQTYNNLEIICINDGSTDSSLKYLKSIKNKKLKIIDQENQGALIARNKGIECATGDYLAFVDSDDWVDKNMFEIIDNYIGEYNSPDIVRFNYETFPEKKKTSNIINNNKNPYQTKIHSEEVYDFLINTSNLNGLVRGVFKKSLFKNNTLYEKVTASNDVLQMYMLLDKAKTVLFLDNVFYYYNYNPNSIVHTVNISRVCSNLTSMLFFRKKSIEYLEKWNICNKHNLMAFAQSMIEYETSTLLKIINGNCSKKDLLLACNTIFNNENHNNMIKHIEKKNVTDNKKLKLFLKKAIYSKNIFIINLFRKVIQLKNKLTAKN